MLAGPLCLPVAAQYGDGDTKGTVTLPQMATAAEMMTLSSIWNVTECCGWTGSWRRRPNTLIFDASWRHTNGTVATDIVRMASWNKANGASIFTRDGNGGRYGGFLDATRRNIQRGNASWQILPA